MGSLLQQRSHYKGTRLQRRRLPALVEAQARERLLVVSPLLGGAGRSNFTWNQPVVAIQAPGHNGTVLLTS